MMTKIMKGWLSRFATACLIGIAGAIVSLSAFGASTVSSVSVNSKTGALSASFSALGAARGVVVAWDAADKGGSLASWTHCAYLGTAAKGATSFAATLPSAARVGKVYRVFLVTNGATAASYVQAGLVLHYDAQENGGVGTHVGSMGGKWVNLVKPGTDDFKTSALTAGSDANGAFVTIASPSSDPSITFAGGDVLPQTGDKMVEVVSRYAGAASDVTTSFLPIFTVAGDGRLGYQSNKGRIVAAFADVTEDNATAPTKGDYASIVNGDYAYRYCTHYSKYQADSEFTEWRSWSVAFDRLGEYSTLHRNDETLLKPTSDAWKRWQSLTYKMDKTYDADGTCFNCEKRSHSATFALGAKGKTVAYRSVRVYKGRLTDAQRTHNYKVDRLRYFGASLADVLTDESPAEDVLAFAASESASEAKSVTALAPTCVEPAAGETVQILTDRQKEFFQLPLEERRALKGKSDYRWSLTYGPLPWYVRTWEESRRPDGTWPRFVPFTWKGTGPFDVRIVRAKDGKVFYEQKGVMANSAEVVNFEADCTYVWSVSNAVGGAQGRFKTEGGYPRLLWDHDPEGHVYNLRDIGGLTVSNGLYKVRQNLIFRSTRLTKDLMDKTGYGNGTGDSVLVQEKYGNRSFWHSTEHDGIGIRHEIDLRGTGQAGTYMRDTLKHSVIGGDVTYSLYNGLSYGEVVGNPTHWKLAHDQLKEIFDKVHDGKPVTIHCQGGKDRTGILCFLMEAIFGESDLEKNQDWEASWFWYAPSGHSIDELFEELEASTLKGATINEKVMSLLTDPKKVGLSQAQIAQFRADMLEPVGEDPVGPTPIDPPEEPEDPEDDPVDPTDYGSADSTAVTYTWKAGVSGPWAYTTNWTPSKTPCYGIPNSANYATAVLPAELPAGTAVTLENKTVNLRRFNVQNANALTLTLDGGKIVMADYGKTGEDNPVSFGATGPATLVFKGANPQLRGQSEGSHGRFYFGETYATTLRFELPATAWTESSAPISAAENANAYFYSKTTFAVDAKAVGTLAAGVAVTNVLVSVGDGGAVKTDNNSTSQLTPLLAKAMFSNLPATMTGSLVVSEDKRSILCIVSGRTEDDPTTYGPADSTAVTYTWKAGVSGPWAYTTSWTPSKTTCYGIPNSANYATAVLPAALPAGTMVSVANETISLRKFDVLNANALTLELDNGKIALAENTDSGNKTPVSFGETGPATIEFMGAAPQIKVTSGSSYGRLYFGKNHATTLRFALPGTPWTKEAAPILSTGEGANIYFYYPNAKVEIDATAATLPTEPADETVYVLASVAKDGGLRGADSGSSAAWSNFVATAASFTGLPADVQGRLEKRTDGDNSLLVCAFVRTAAPTVAPSGLKPNGTATPVAIHTAAQNTFLSKSMEERRDYATTTEGREAMRTEVTGRWPNAEQPDNEYAKKTSGTFPQWVTLTWTGEGPFTVEVFRKADDRLFFKRENVSANSVDVFNFELDTEYVWRVTNAAGVSETATFKTDNVFPRLLWDHDDLGQIYGVRDLGGAKGRHGLVVRQGLLIRSSEPMKGTTSYATDTAFWTGTALDGLGIRYELDLRSEEQTGYATASGFGDGVIYNNNEIDSYQDIFEEKHTAAFKAALDVALDSANYPLNFHCQIGKDRTGSLALVLEALLGMSKDDIMRDFEASWFWYKPNDNPVDDAYSQIDRLLACVETFQGSTFNAKVASYCFSLGVTQAQLDAFRTAMLGEGGAAPTEDDASVARGEVDPEDYGDPDTKAVTYTWKPGVSGAWKCTTNWTPSVALCYGIPDNADYATAVLPADLPAGTAVTVADETIRLRRFNVLNANALTLVLDNGRIVVSEGASKADNPVEIGKTGPATVEFRGERPQLEAQSAGSDGRVYFGENYATTLRFALPATAWTHATAPIRMSNEGANVYFYANTSFEVDVGSAVLPALGEAVTNVLVSVYDDPEYPGGIRPFDDDLNLVLKTQTAFTGLPADVEGRLEKVDATIICILSREVPPAETSVSVASVAQDGTVTLAIDALRSDAYLTVGYGTNLVESCLCADRGGWQYVKIVGKVEAGATDYVFTLPDGWGSDYEQFRVFLTLPEVTPIEFYASATATDGTSCIDTLVVPTPTTQFNVIFESTTLTKDQMKGKTVFEATSDELPSSYFHYRMFVNASGYPAFDWGDTANGTVIGSTAVKQTSPDGYGIRWQFAESGSAINARYRWGEDSSDRLSKAVSGTPTQTAAGSVRVYGLGSITRIDALDASRPESRRYMFPAKGFDASGNEVFGFFDSQSHQMYPFHGTFALGEVVPFRNDQFDGSPYVAESETFTYEAPTAAAEIGGKSYATVAEAMAAAKPGETVKLVADPGAAVIELKGGVDVDLVAFDAAKVTFALPAGVDWFDVPTGPKHDAVYALQLNDRAKPVIANDGDAAGIAVTDSKVAIHITNVKPGLYYALYAADALGTPADEWTKVVDFAADKVDFEADTAGHAARFFKVVVGDRP